MGRSTPWGIIREPPLALAIVFSVGVRLAFHWLYDLNYDLDAGWWQMLEYLGPVMSRERVDDGRGHANLLEASGRSSRGTSGATGRCRRPIGMTGPAFGV